MGRVDDQSLRAVPSTVHQPSQVNDAVPYTLLTCRRERYWLLLGVMGVIASVGHYLLIRAYDYASATLLAPYTYSGLIWAMLLGLLVFGHFPDGWSLAGMGVIALSGLFLASRQRLTVHRG